MFSESVTIKHIPSPLFVLLITLAGSLVTISIYIRSYFVFCF
jgi:hypothetical protein